MKAIKNMERCNKMNEKNERGKIDWMITLLPLGIVIALCVLFFFMPEQSNAVLSQIRFFFGDTFGTYYLVIGLGIFILSLYIAGSRYGNIVLGEPNEKPKYSFFAWGSMMFTCGLAADILFYSFSEWVLYATDPHIEEMGTIQDWAGVYPLFHWSFIPWGFYLVLAVAFGFMLPLLAGFIAMSIADRPGLAVGFVGGAIAANGKSGFLGALVAGFLAGYLILLLKKLFEKLPEALKKIAPVLLYPVFGILIVGLVMTFVVEPPIGALNTALNTALTNMGGSSKILLGIIVAGMMSADMGGPFNKAAYVFGTASIAAGNYGIMAAVMIGGMVPPCAIALASLLFKDKFTKTERESAPTNFIMGLAFITEGAIPFAASDPLHVIPACVIGSGLAGALSMAFNCTLMAPHGGIFVFPVVGNPLMYLAALAVGTVVGALMLGVLKKKIAE